MFLGKLSEEALFIQGCMQARRHDLAAGGVKNQKEGPKTRRGTHF